MCVLPEEAQLISPNFPRRPAPLNPHCSTPHRFTRDGRTWELEAEPLDHSSYSCISLAELLQPILAEEARECTKKRGSLEDGDVTKPRRQTTYVLATRRSPCAARCGRLLWPPPIIAPQFQKLQDHLPTTGSEYRCHRQQTLSSATSLPPDA